MATTPDGTPVETGFSDTVYDLVLLLQQALEDCTRYQTFAADARREGDEEVAAYFDELTENDREVAAKARTLLAARL
jgi:hypothetical protein